jgi:hypothetical protein
MHSFGTWQWIALVALIVIGWAFVSVFGRILNRAGYSRWWLLTLAVPLVNLIMLWVFAFADWPVAKPRAQG